MGLLGDLMRGDMHFGFLSGKRLSDTSYLGNRRTPKNYLRTT